MAVSDAQERGKPEMLFRNHWQRSTPKGFGANEIVLGERVEGEEQGCGQHPCAWGGGKEASEADSGVARIEGEAGESHKRQRSKRFQEGC